MRTALDDALDAVVPDTTPRPTPPAPGAQLVTGLLDLPVDDLHPSPANPREHMTDIAELAESIRENGLIQPIIARVDPDVGYVIVAGHRRHAAVQALGWLRVQTLVRKAMPPDAELAAMLVENGQRAGLDPIEEARALHRLKTTTGCSDGDLARRVGRSQPTVSGRLALLSLPIEQQEEIRAGQMTVSRGGPRRPPDLWQGSPTRQGRRLAPGPHPRARGLGRGPVQAAAALARPHRRRHRVRGVLGVRHQGRRAAGHPRALGAHRVVRDLFRALCPAGGQAVSTELAVTANLAIDPWSDVPVSDLNTTDTGRHRSAVLERIGLLPDATSTGRATVAVLVRLPDGRTVAAETTLASFRLAAAFLLHTPVAEMDGM